jgi:hypothetical protein
MPSKTVRKGNNTNSKRSKTSVNHYPSANNTTLNAPPKAEDKLWSVLRDNPGGTTAELASKAEVGKSTAARILAKWATDGSVTRTPGTGPRTADTWTVPVDVPPVEATAEETTPADSSDAITSAPDDAGVSAPPNALDPVVEPDEGTTAPVSRRLPPGGLHGMVEDFLRAHPNEEFGPGAIAKALGRSSGAVSNALDKMAASGLSVQTSPKPKRFQLAPAERAEARE